MTRLGDSRDPASRPREATHRAAGGRLLGESDDPAASFLDAFVSEFPLAAPAASCSPGRTCIGTQSLIARMHCGSQLLHLGHAREQSS
jgi:hypothetical protein